VADSGATDTVVDKITKVINQYAPNKKKGKRILRKPETFLFENNF
jgi:hypothetical protein